MSSFVDKKGYYFKLVSTPEGMKIKYTLKTEEIMDIPYDILEYYLQHYTLQKGTFINQFRKILCEDGYERFYGKEHKEHKNSVKAETISIKNIQLGESLLLHGNQELFYIGSFYRKDYSVTRVHAFISERDNSISYYRNLKRFTEIVDFKEIYIDINHNYEKYILPDSERRYAKYYITKGDIK